MKANPTITPKALAAIMQDDAMMASNIWHMQVLPSGIVCAYVLDSGTPVPVVGFKIIDGVWNVLSLPGHDAMIPLAQQFLANILNRVAAI